MKVRRNLIYFPVLVACVLTIAWLRWPNDLDGLVAQVEARGGKVLVQKDTKNRRYINVIFSYRPLADADLPELTSLATVPDLCLFLDATKITDLGLDHIRTLRQIRTLSLSGTEITDKGLEKLTGLDHLEKLRLKDCPVTDRGLQSLYGLPALEYLDVQQTRVTEDGVQRLRRARPGLKIAHIAKDDD
jgi:hypothetical protein